MAAYVGSQVAGLAGSTVTVWPITVSGKGPMGHMKVIGSTS